jgi:hypothetical protein
MISYLASSFAQYGWETKSASCEIAGVGEGEILQMTVTFQMPHIARWRENRWVINMGYINPEEAAAKNIDALNAVRAQLLGFGTSVLYTSSGELALILPENAGIANRAELENFARRVEYGGGTYTETNMFIEEREGRPAVVARSREMIATENITITPQELAQEYERGLSIEYTGVPPQAEKGGAYLLYLAVGLPVVIVIVVLLKRR